MFKIRRGEEYVTLPLTLGPGDMKAGPRKK
jgi:hypothetical protein